MNKLIKCLPLVTLFFLTGCNEKQNENDPTPVCPIVDEHVHTFSNSYEYDEINHWKSATCDHTDLTKDLSTHSFDDNKCTICGYEKIVENVKYTITFVDEMNKEINTLSVEKNKNITPIDNPTFDGYTFTGWVDKEENSFGLKDNDIWSTYKVEKDLTLFASYSPNLVNLKVSCDSFLGEFDINIDDEDYINSFDKEVEVGTVIKLKAKPKDYADFSKWTMSTSTLSDNNIFTFIVENKDYDINLDLIGKEYILTINQINCICTSKSNKYRAGDNVVLSSIASTPGFTFNGYYDSEDNLLHNEYLYSFRMPGKDYEISARMYGSKHTVTIHSTKIDSDSFIVPFGEDEIIDVYCGQHIILKPTEYNGYKCTNPSIDILVPDYDLEYSFVYEPITYSITYCNIYGGEYTGDNKNSLPTSYTTDKSINIPQPTIESSYLTAKHFWYLDSDCSGEYINGVIPSDTYAKDLVLYAKIEYWNDDGMKECVVNYVDEDNNKLADSINLGKKHFNEIITGYDIPRINPEIYTLKTNAYGSRMGLTSENQFDIYVVYEKKLCNLEYILIFPDGSSKPYSFGQIIDSAQEPLRQYRVTSNDPLICPNKPLASPSRILHNPVGLYLDDELTIPATNVNPNWRGTIQLYIKMVPIN